MAPIVFCDLAVPGILLGLAALPGGTSPFCTVCSCPDIGDRGAGVAPEAIRLRNLKIVAV